MKNPAAPKIQTTGLGRATSDAVVWRHRGQLRVTVIAKATFALVPGGPMRWMETPPVRDGETHHGNLPNRSVAATSERAPYLGRTDVTLVGHACAPGDVPVRSMNVRLAVIRDGAALLDKRIVARGDGGGQEPFTRMQLAYENALGGVGSQDNPFGKAVANLVRPEAPSEVACFAPLARAWPSRWRARGDVPRSALEGPLLDIPDAMDWSYFQAAPADQRIEPLRGDEHVLIEGIHPKYTSLHTQLPAAIGVARVQGPFEGSHRRTMRLQADTLAIDADRLCCTVLWRESFRMEDDASLASLRITVGVETRWGPLEWDAEPEMLDSIDLVEIEEDAPHTMRLSATPHTLEIAPRAAPRAAVPFLVGAPASAAASLPLPPRATARRRTMIGDTVELEPEEMEVPRSLPFLEAGESEPPPLAAAPPVPLPAPPPAAPPPPAASPAPPAAASPAPPAAASPAPPPPAAPPVEVRVAPAAPARMDPATAYNAYSAAPPPRIETAAEAPVELRPPTPPKKKEPPPLERILYGRFGRRA